jgi:hypothetical protein
VRSATTAVNEQSDDDDVCIRRGGVDNRSKIGATRETSGGG